MYANQLLTARIDIYAKQHELTLVDDNKWSMEEINDAVAGGYQQLGTNPLQNKSPFRSILNTTMLEADLDVDTLHGLRLAQALLGRFRRIGHSHDLEEVTSICSSVLGTGCTDTNKTLLAKGLKGVAHRLKFEHMGNLTDLDISVDLLKDALALALPSHTIYSYIEAHLGRSLQTRFENNGNRSDLNEAQERLTHASSNVLEGDPYRGLCLTSLGRLRAWIYGTNGDITELHQAIDHLTVALRLHPNGHQNRHDTLLGLFTIHYFLYMSRADPSDVTYCLSYTHEALQLCPTGHPARGEALRKRAVALSLRYLRSGDVQHLDEVINVSREAVASCPHGHPNRHGVLMNLATDLSQRVQKRSTWKDLDEAIQLRRECLSLVKPGHPERAFVLFTAAMDLLQRYEALGHDSDLGECVALGQESLDLTADGEPIQCGALSLLINALLGRFEATGCEQDLTGAIRLAWTWSDKKSRFDYDLRSSSAANVAAGQAHIRYYMQCGDVTSLDEAVILFSQTDKIFVDADSHEHQRASCLHALANALLLRFKHTHTIEDLDQAIEARNLAMKSLGRTDLRYPVQLCGAAHLHLIPNTRYHNLTLALDMLVDALTMSARNPRAILGDLLDALETLETNVYVDLANPDPNFEVSIQERLMQIYDHASALLPQAAYLGLDNLSRLRVLRKSDSICVRAASQAVLSNRPERAIELLEETHSMFWTQYLRLRTSLDTLPLDMDNELKFLTHQITLVQRGEELEGDHVARQQDLCQRLDKLLEHIRGQPGLERFMLHSTYGTISQVASAGPVFVLLQSRLSAFCLLIRRPGSPPERIDLPGINDVLLDRLVSSLRFAGTYVRAVTTSRGMCSSGRSTDQSRVMLSKLWINVMKPIIESLGVTVSTAHRVLLREPMH